MSDSSLKTLYYDSLGGEAGLRKLVNAFYMYMDTLPEVRSIRDMHPANLETSADKLFMFLSGWTGGPSLFAEKYGHPRLRARHLPFVIDKAERDQWMLCMVHAVEHCEIQEPIRSEFLHAMLAMANHMRNKEQHDSAATSRQGDPNGKE